MSCPYSIEKSFVDTKNRGARGKVWGSDDINVEGWKALKRLPGHESGLLFFKLGHNNHSFWKQT